MYVLASASVKVVQRYIESIGFTGEQLYKDTDVNISKLNDPEYKITRHTSDMVFANAARLTQNSGYAIYCGETFKLSDLGLMGYIISNNDTMFSVIQKYTHYQKVIGLATETSYKENSDTIHIIFTDSLQKQKSLAGRYRIDCTMSCFLKTCIILTGSRPPVTEIHFTDKLLKDKQQYSDYFQVPIKTGRAHNAVVFPKQYFKMQKVRNKSSIQFLEELAQKLLKTRDYRSNFTDMITEHLVNNDNFNMPVDVIASKFFINKRTLQKKLKDEGTSFREIVSKLKKEKAIHFLTDQNLSINQITDLLGFEETGSFIRAFHRWTGYTPGRYRQKSNCNI